MVQNLLLPELRQDTASTLMSNQPGYVVQGLHPIVAHMHSVFAYSFDNYWNS